MKSFATFVCGFDGYSRCPAWVLIDGIRCCWRRQQQHAQQNRCLPASSIRSHLRRGRNPWAYTDAVVSTDRHRRSLSVAELWPRWNRANNRRCKLASDGLVTSRYADVQLRNGFELDRRSYWVVVATGPLGYLVACCYDVLVISGIGTAVPALLLLISVSLDRSRSISLSYKKLL